jgi:hypothetical protein
MDLLLLTKQFRFIEEETDADALAGAYVMPQYLDYINGYMI